MNLNFASVELWESFTNAWIDQLFSPFFYSFHSSYFFMNCLMFMIVIYDLSRFKDGFFF